MLIAHCHKQGIEHKLLFVEARFNWQEFTESASTVGMFSARQLLVLYFSKAPDKNASKYLNTYLQQPPPDCTVVIHAPKLEAATQNTAWYKRIDKLGAIIRTYPIDHRQLPIWLRNRAQAAGLNLSAEAIQILAHRTEGNLLAAHQALQRLQLVAEKDQDIDDATVSKAAVDMSRYNVFDLVDCALGQDVAGCINRLERLQSQGTQPMAILNALLREIRILSASFDAVEHGMSLSAALQKEGVWRSRIPLMRKAYEHHTANTVQNLLRQAHIADSAAKGAANISVWHALSRLVLRVAGMRIAT